MNRRADRERQHSSRPRQRYWEIWGSIALAIAVCGVVAWINMSHQSRLARATHRQDMLRQARVDLSRGLLALSIAEDDTSPFQRDQGMALIGQAMYALKRASAERSEQEGAQFRDAAQRFQDAVATIGDIHRAGAEKVTALRIAFHDVEARTDQLEEQARQDMMRLHGALSQEFTVTLVLAALLLCGGGVALFLSASARENAEALRQAIASRHETTLRSIGDGVIVTDGQGRVEFLNPEAERLTGWTDAEARGLPLGDIFTILNERTRAPVPSPVDLVLREGGQVALANGTVLVSRGGRELPIADSAAPIRDDTEEISGVVLVFRDQSHEKHYKQALKDSELHFRALANNGQALIWTAGTDKLCNYFNEPWLKFTGRPLEKELGNGWAEGVHPDDFDRCLKIYVTAFDRRERFSMEYRLRHASGQYRWILDQGTPRYDSDGVFAGYIGHCMDIHEMKEAEDRLRKLSRALEQSPAGTVIMNLDGRVEYANPAYGSITGLDWKAAIGRRAHFLESGDLAETFNAGLWNDIAAGQDWHGESHNVRRNGEPYWEAISLSPLRNAEGVITHVIAVKEDITERKAAIRALEESEERFRRIVETANEGIWTLGPDDRTTYMNPTLAAMLGCEPDEVLGRLMTDFMFPEDMKDYKARMRTRHDGVAERYERRLRAKNGAERWTLISASPIIGPEGEFAGSVGMCADITESKRVQRILETRVEMGRLAQEEGLEAVLDAALAAAETLTLSTTGFFYIADEEGTPLPYRWSNRTREMCAVPGQEGMRNLGRVVRSGRPLVRNDIGETGKPLPEGHMPIERELLAPVQDGGRLVACLGVANKPLDYDKTDVDTLSTLAGMAWEVVNRERARTALIRSKELAEAAAKAKSEFLANMSHEIRTPLNGVLGMLQLLQGGAGPEERARFTAMALDAGRRLLDLLNDILDFSRLEAGGTTLRREPFRLREVCDAVTNVLGLVSRSKGLPLSCEVGPGVPAVLLGDEARLRQILFNLVGNSIKFTQTGSIRIGAEATQSAMKAGAWRLHLWVADTGVGIEDERIGYLFERFTQSDASYARRFEGAGLGLAIVKRIVNLMAGNICVESEPGVGTTVHISLPMEAGGDALPAADRRREKPAAAPKGLRILVAEDDEISRLSIQVMLGRMGHSCAMAGNGRQAVELLEREDFDCILMDVQMPEMDGVTATRVIRSATELGARSKVPIIALTAHAMAGDRERFLAAGMDDHVAKPVQAEELAAALAKIGRKGS